MGQGEKLEVCKKAIIFLLMQKKMLQEEQKTKRPEAEVCWYESWTQDQKTFTAWTHRSVYLLLLLIYLLYSFVCLLFLYLFN